jgi:hypothetical protein
LVYRDPDGQLVKRNLSLNDAAREAQRVFAEANFHDFLDAHTGKAFGGINILTLNLVDFRKMTNLPLELPVQP